MWFVPNLEVMVITMPDKLPLKKIDLEYFRLDSSRRTMRRSAAQHGYKGRFASLRFFLASLNDYLLHTIAYFSPIPSLRVMCQRKRGVRIGKNVQIGPHVIIDTVFPSFVVIEEGVSLAGSNYILAHNTPLEFHSNDFPSFVAPVVIKKNAWITIGAIILPGVTVGEGSVVGAGSVVIKDIPAHTFVGGIPAKYIRSLTRAKENERAKDE